MKKYYPVKRVQPGISHCYVILNEVGKKTARMYTKTVQRVISRHILRSTEQVLKKILLLKVVKNF